MTVRLTRTSWGTGTVDLWGVEVDDAGRATVSQTSGDRVGRFARDLSEAERDALDRALAAARTASRARAADETRPPVSPSGATEQLVADDLPGIALDPDDEPPSGYAELLAILSTLREEVADHPVAAIELEVAGSPLAARLRHLGSEPVAVQMGTLSVDVTLFGAGSALLETRTYTVDASGIESPVGPGWALPLVDDLGIAGPPPGGFLTVTVGTPDVDSLGDGVLRTAEFGWMIE